MDIVLNCNDYNSSITYDQSLTELFLIKNCVPTKEVETEFSKTKCGIEKAPSKSNDNCFYSGLKLILSLDKTRIIANSFTAPHYFYYYF